MKTKKIRNICIIFLFIILFIYLSICINSYVNGNKIGIFSLRFYIMSSDSSESDVSSGDLVIAKSIKTEDIKENDDIIYKRNDSMVVKKVKIIENNNGNINFYIEDDNIISNEKIENAQIIGKVIFKIKGFGNFALFIQSPMGTLNILVIAICIIIIIKKISKSVQESKDDLSNEDKTNEELFSKNKIDKKQEEKENE